MPHFKQLATQYRRVSLAAALLLCISLPAYGQTDYVWSGGNGVWSEAANWTPNGVPSASDYATIGGGVASLSANVEIARLEISGLGVINGNFDITVTDSLLWSGGGSGFETFRDSGLVEIAASATLRMLDPTTRFQMASKRTLVNNGTAIWEGHGEWQGEARFLNNGTLLITRPGTIAFSNLSDAITNSSSGQIRKIGPGEAVYWAGLINDGAIIVEGGTLDVSGFNAIGLSGSGSIEVESGAALIIGGAANAITGDGGIFGLGEVWMTGGSLWVDGTYDVKTTNISGTRFFPNNTSQSDTLEMSGGELNGSGTFTVGQVFEWSGGLMNGTGTTILGPNVPVTISGSNTIGVSEERTLQIDGASSWTGTAKFSNGHAATLVNAGTMTISGPETRSFFAGTFLNEGTIIHQEGELTFSSGMSNSGSVMIEGGLVRQQGFNATGGTDSGRYEVAAGSQLLFVGGNRTLTEDATLAGEGSVGINFGLTNNGVWSPGPPSGGIGTLAIITDYPASGTLEIEIGGTTPAMEYDQLIVSGAATLGGKLDVSFANSFQPTIGDRFLIIDATGGATGSYDEIVLPNGVDAFVEVSTGGAELVIGTRVSNEKASDLPDTFALTEVYPNPFSQNGNLSFEVPTRGLVQIAIYDALGRQTTVLVDEDKNPGRYTVPIGGGRLPAGVYLVRMVASGYAATKQMVVL